MLDAVILPPAKQDIRKAAHWYNNKEHGLGRRFTSAIREKVRFIKKHPEAAPIRYAKVRTSVIDSFHFMIHYRVETENQRIVISAVFHTSLSPDRWDER